MTVLTRSMSRIQSIQRQQYPVHELLKKNVKPSTSSINRAVNNPVLELLKKHTQSFVSGVKDTDKPITIEIYVNTLVGAFNICKSSVEKRVQLNTCRFVFDFILANPLYLHKKIFDVMVSKLKEFSVPGKFTQKDITYYTQKIEELRALKGY